MIRSGSIDGMCSDGPADWLTGDTPARLSSHFTLTVSYFLPNRSFQVAYLVSTERRRGAHLSNALEWE